MYRNSQTNKHSNSPRFIELIGAAFLLPITIALNIPVTLLDRNIGEIFVNQSILFYIFFVFALTSTTSILVFLLFKNDRRFYYIPRLFIIISLFVISNNVIRHIIPDDFKSETFILTISLDIISFAILSVIFFIKFAKICRFAAVLSVIQLIFIGFNAKALFIEETIVNEKIGEIVSDSIVGDSKEIFIESKHNDKNIKPNIYHIILDGFQREMFERQLRKEGDGEYDGFIFFENYRTTSWVSQISMFNTLSTRLIGKNDVPTKNLPTSGRWKFRAAELRNNIQRKNTYFNLLSENNYALDLYPFDAMCTDAKKSLFLKGVALCHSSRDASSKDSVGDDSHVFIDLWVQNLLPSSVLLALNSGLNNAEHDPRSWNYGFAISKAFNKSLNDAPLDTKKLRNLPKSVLKPPALSVINFRRLIKNEQNRSNRNRYVYAHLMIPHPPVILDEECRYSGPKNSKPKHFGTPLFAQSRCGMHLVDTFIGELKRLGRYNDSMIVVHSDHGYFVNPQLLEDLGINYWNIPKLKKPYRTGSVFPHPWSPAPYDDVPHPAIETASAGLLLIKFPSSVREDGIKRSQTKVQNIDLGPTILNVAGIKNKRPDSFAINPNGETARDKYVFQAWAKNLNEALMSNYTRSDGEWRFHRHIGSWYK